MSGFDVKDLRVLDEVYKTRNISAAVDKLGLSQPSISIRLGRLRKHFNDPLFVRTSSGMQPTPRTEALIASVRQALGLFDGHVGQQAAFRPHTVERSFRICMTNVGQIVILPKLLNRLKTVAPSVTVDVDDLDADTPRLLEAGEADLALGFTLEIRAGFYQQKLFTEHYVCMASKRHPRIGAQITRKQFVAESHVSVSTRGTGHWVLDKAIEDEGIARRIALRVPSFLGLAQIVASTDLLALVPIHLAEILAQDGGVKILRAPFKQPSYLVKQYWHERYHRDPANRWLRALVSELFLE